MAEYAGLFWRSPDNVDDLGLQYIMANKAWASLGSELERMSHNLELSHYISYLQQAVQRVEDRNDKSRPEQHSLL